METRLTEIKLLLADGTEIPAQIVLRDKDLDLAFVRPLEAVEKPLASVEMKAGDGAQILDPVVVIGRTGRAAGRVSSVNVDRIHAIIERPRKLYMIGSGDGGAGLGAPAFSIDGAPLGLLVMRTIKISGAQSFSLTGGMTDNFIPVIVPCAEIAKAAAQAPTEAPKEESVEAAGPAEKPAEP
jgi:S1-C subfamily serine protease